MANYPKISIITPSYNQGQYIEQTILSVLEQGYPNLEYIVIDGGSKDNTVDILKKYNDRIAYWVSEPDKGQAHAINKGFEKATGDIINWINSDDYYAPGTLANVAASFKNPLTKAVTTVVRNFNDDGVEWDELTDKRNTNIEYIARSFNNQPGTFFRKEIWEPYFPLPAQLHYTMDQYIWFCFWLENGTSSLRREKYTTAFFRRHLASKTSVSTADIVFNYLGKIFFNEHNLIFWSYFFEKDEGKAKTIAAYFSPDFQYMAKKISFPSITDLTKPQQEELFQLYLFQLLKEDLKHGFFERLKANLSQLDLSFFTEAEAKAIRKMKLASSNAKLFRSYRSIYWKLKAAVTKS